MDQAKSPHSRKRSKRATTLSDPGALLKQLQDHRPGLRSKALRALAEMKGTEITEKIAQLLKDPQHGIRLNAARILGERRARKAVGALLDQLAVEGDREALTSVIQALARIGGQRVSDHFAAVLGNPESPAHRLVLENLPGDASAEVAKSLLDLSCQALYPWRSQALEALSRFSDPRVPDVLVPLLSDPDPAIAHAAARMLERYPCAAACQRAGEVLKSSAPESVRIAALRLVAAQGGAGMLRQLEALLSGTDEMAVAYLEALRESRTTGLETLVSPLVNGPNADVAVAALGYLKVAGSRHCLETLQRALASPNWSIRQKACEVLAELKLAGGLEPALAATGDGNRHVRRAALDAICSYHDERVEVALVRLLGDDYPENRAHAVRRLAATGSSSVRQPILGRLTDPHASVRRAACECLESFDLSGQLDVIVRLCSDEDAGVRAAAQHLLKSAGDPSSQTTLAQAYYHIDCREYDKAERVLLLLLATNPVEYKVHYELGRLYGRTGRMEQARIHLERAFELQPDHLGCLKSFSRLLMRQKDYQAAERVLGRLLAVMPSNLRAQKDLGVVQFEQGHFESARDLFTAVVESTPDDLESQERLGRCQLALGAHDEARHCFDLVARDDPFAVRIRGLQGDVEMAAGNPAEAISHYQAALGQLPGNVALMERLHAAYEASGNLVLALEVARKLVERDPASPRRLHLVAKSYLAVGDTTRAEATVAQWLSTQADNVEALELKARVHEARQEYHKALDIYFRIHGLDNRTPQLLLKIGAVYQKNGQKEQALRCFREYLAENPKDYETRLLLARADREAGNLAEALRKLSVCVTQCPRDHRGFSELAVTYKLARDSKRALVQAQAAHRLAPRDVDVLNLVGELSLAEGAVEEALAYLEQSVAILPDQNLAHRLLVSAHHQRSDHARVVFHHHRCLNHSDSPVRFALEVGIAYGKLGHVAKAREWLDRGLMGAADSVELLRARMEVELASGDAERGLEWALRLLKVAPLEVEARRQAGLILVKRGEHKSAEDLLRGSLEARPADVEVREALGVALFGQGRYDEVLRLAEADPSGGEPSTAWQLLKASAYFRADKLAPARDALEILIRRKPGVVAAHQLLARIHQALSDFVAAEMSLNRAIQLDSTNVGLYVERGRVYLKRREYDRARQDLVKIHREAPQHPVVLKLLGRLEEEVGNPHQARAYLENYLQLEPHDAEGHHLRGVVLRRTGQLEAALECQTNAMELAPKMAEPYLQAGELCLAQKDSQRARAYLETYLSLAPASVAALKLMVSVSEAEGNAHATRYYLEQLLKVEESPRESYVAYLEILFATGEVQEAWKIVDRIMPEMPELVTSVAHKLMERGQPMTAREILKRVVNITPSADRLFDLAMANLAMDRPNVALETLRKAVELEPGHFKANLHLGSLARTAGDLREARVTLARAARLDPDSVEAMAELAALLHGEGQHVDAARVVARALSAGDGQPPEAVYLLAGEIYQALGQDDRALECYTRCAGAGGSGGVAHVRAAHLERARGADAKARDLYRAALAQRPADADARRELARVLMEMGAYEEAAREWEILGAAEGFGAAILEPLVHAYMRCHRWDEAEQFNRRLLGVESDHLAGLLNAGALAIERNRISEAHMHYQAACQAHPESVEPQRRAAEALISQGRFQEALGFARRACELDPDASGAHLSLGRIYLKLAMPEKGRDALERAVNLMEKTDPDVAVELSRAYRALNMNREAVDLLERVKAGHTLHRDVALELAALHFEAKDYTRTLEILRDVDHGAQPEAGVLEMMGLAYARVGMNQKAADCIARLAQISQVSERLVVELARQNLESGRPTEALGVLEDALRPTPDNVLLGLELARVHVRLKSFGEAERVITRILAAAPGNQEAQELAGELFEKSRNYDRMRTLFTQVVRQYPFQAQSHLYLGRANLFLKKFPEAREAFRRAICLDSNMPDAHVALARTLREEGQPMRAVDEYKLALKLRPNDPESIFELATLFEMLNQRELAQYHFRELTRREPRDSKWAHVARERLEHAARAVGRA